MLLNYNLYFQQQNASSSIELRTGNDSISNCFMFDFEILEDAQVSYKPIFLTSVEKNTEQNYFHISCRLSPPYFTVWQPPKLS